MKPSQATSLPVPCAAWANHLAALHPDDLTRDEQTALQQHLAGCPACAAVYAAYQQIDARILSLPVVQLSAQQVAQVQAVMTDHTVHEPEGAVTAMLQEHLVPPARVPTRLVQVARQANALAALLIVVVLVASVFALFSLGHAPSPASPTGDGTSAPVSPPSTLYTVSATGTVYAIDPASGTIIWSTPLQMTPDEQFLIADGTIFLASNCIRSTCDLYALRAGDGHVLWQRSYHSLLGNAGATSLAAYLASDGNALYIGSATGIYAWRTSDGQQLWYHAPPPACLANPDGCFIDMGTASNGLVYVFFDGLYALNATDGHTRWSNLQVPDVGGDAHPLVVTHNHIYVPDYGGGPTLHVLQADTGKLLDTLGLPHVTAADIITDGSVVYINTTPAAGGGADIYAVRSDDNQVLWHQHEANGATLDTASTGSLYYSYMAASTSASAQNVSVKPSAVALSTPPTVRPPAMVVSTTTSSALTRLTIQVCARRTTDGALQWCHSLPGSGFPSAAASQGIIYTTGDGLVAIRLSDGKVLWHILASIQLDDADTVLV
jgi:outer membrane protein assembly factor BamB